MPIRGISVVRQKSFNLAIRGRQAMNRDKTSYPFISGDSFANACDVAVYGKKEISQGQLENARSIFCPSEKLEEFLVAYGEKISAEVLVFGNTDRDFYELNCDFPLSVKTVYLQNSHISNGFFHTLPIGIENLRYGRNGQLSLFKNSFAGQKKIQKILVGPFSPTHPERNELDTWKSIQHSRLQITSEHLKPKALALWASNFQFIACPRGNGTDTHRFWEALYRGSVPVVKRSAWSESIKDLQIPMIQLESWDFEEFIERSEPVASLSIQPEKIPALWMGHWETIFGLDVKKSF
jgi:hypothetical protein